MLYIKNNKQYALKFVVVRENREVPFVFDCFRRYRDTGNIVTTGVTPLNEGDFDYLYKNVPAFKKAFDTGMLSKTTESGATQVANQITALEKENEVLKQELVRQKEEMASLVPEDVQKLQEENNNMKKELEALKKKQKKQEEKQKQEEKKEEEKKEEEKKEEKKEEKAETQIDSSENF